MYPNVFEYHRATSVEEAVGILSADPEAKILAGGHSLIPAMKLRLAMPGMLVDLSQIDSLKGITVDGGATIGAMTTYRQLLDSDELASAFPVIRTTAKVVGDPAVRNRGTIGGALAHADPAADAPAVVLALDGQIRAQGPSGERTIAISDFFTDMLTTALAPDELLTAVIVNRLGAGEGAAYAKFAHPASRYAIVGAAAYVKLADGKLSACRVAITGAGPMAVRLNEVEQAVLGGDGSTEAISSATANAGAGMDILGDIHASEEYRRAMVGVYARRALTQALARARG